MNDASEELVVCDGEVKRHIDRAMSACFEIVAELMYMRTVTSETPEGRNRLRDGLDEIVDMNKSMVHELRKINDLIEFGG